MRPEDETRLRHMLEAGQAAQSFIVGRLRADLDTDQMLLFALVRAIEIIGEAASKVSPETRASLAAVPWPNVIAMRHRLAHAYFDIDRTIVWKSVEEEIPALLAALRVALED